MQLQRDCGGEAFSDFFLERVRAAELDDEDAVPEVGKLGVRGDFTGGAVGAEGGVDGEGEGGDEDW